MEMCKDILDRVRLPMGNALAKSGDNHFLFHFLYSALSPHINFQECSNYIHEGGPMGHGISLVFPAYKCVGLLKD